MTKRIALCLLTILVALAGWLTLRDGGDSATDVASTALRPGHASALEAVQTDSPESAGVASDREENTASARLAAILPTHRIFGRIVDDKRFGAPGVTVEIQCMGRASVETVTAASGAFEVLYTAAWGHPTLHHSVTATDAYHRSTVLQFRLPRETAGEQVDVDVGTLALRSAYPLTVLVQDDEVRAGHASVQVFVGHEQAFVGDFRANERGELELTSLPRGAVYLTSRADSREGNSLCYVPEQTRAIIELQQQYAIDVLLVDASTGEGIDGGTLDVMHTTRVPAAMPHELSRLSVTGEYVSTQQLLNMQVTTDALGRARIEQLVPGSIYYLKATAAHYEESTPYRQLGEELRQTQEVLRVEMKSLLVRQVRWPVVGSEHPAPQDGSLIQLRYLPGIPSRLRVPPVLQAGRMELDWLVIDDFVGPAHFMMAEAPDGDLARLWIDADESLGKAISFRTPARIDVLVLDESREPVTGALVQVTNHGNNDLCDPELTDAEGRAVIDGLHGGLVIVHVRAVGQRSGRGLEAGTIDLEKGDATLEVVLEASPAPVRLGVRIDGVAQLPGHYAVRGGRVIEELPERGELLIELPALPATKPASVWFDAAGFALLQPSFEPTVGSAERSATIQLERTATLIARVTPPAQGAVSILPQWFDTASNEWGQAPGLTKPGGNNTPNGPDGSYLFPRIVAGSWRVIDRRSGLTSTEVEIQAGSPSGIVDLDLRNLTWVEGTVEADDPEQLDRVRMLVLHEGVEPNKSGRSGLSSAGGVRLQNTSFRVQVPGDKMVTVYPWHPWLVPDSASGTLVTTGGRAGVRLRLVDGDELRIHLPQIPWYTRSVRIARFADGAVPESEVLEWHQGTYVDGVVRCSMPSGRWTLIVVPPANFAPLTMHGVEIRGSTIVSSANLDAGSTLRVRVLTPEGVAAPRVHVTATRIGAPIYSRSVNTIGSELVQLKGIGPGLFHVTVETAQGNRSLPVQKLQVDGVSDIELEFDLR